MPKRNQICGGNPSILNISYYHMILMWNDVLDLLSGEKDRHVYLRSYHKYFKKELRKLPIEKLREIVDELLSSHQDVFYKTEMNYKQVFELCVILKEIDEMFRNLEQVAILKNEFHKTRNYDI